jgi:hypothetical protein
VHLLVWWLLLLLLTRPMLLPLLWVRTILLGLALRPTSSMMLPVRVVLQIAWRCSCACSRPVTVETLCAA